MFRLFETLYKSLLTTSCSCVIITDYILQSCVAGSVKAVPAAGSSVLPCVPQSFTFYHVETLIPHFFLTVHNERNGPVNTKNYN